MGSRRRQLLGLLTPSLLCFLLAVLSIIDMYLPRPFDGVVLEADAPGTRLVRQVVPGSGADHAGIRAGDLIVGIDRDIIEPGSATHAQQLLNRHRIGETIPYLIRSGGQVFEVQVELGRRRIGDIGYLLACVLGFTFFGVGMFVVIRQPRLPAARVFSIMCSLFLIFLVCRLRPASYRWVDTLILTTGTMALLFLPASFLHFFVIFPRPVWEWRRDLMARTVRWIARRSRNLVPLYLLPPLIYVAVVLRSRLNHVPLDLISGAPAANWWVMAAYMVLGLGALGITAARVRDVRERRGAALVFAGAVFGVVPFIVLAVGFPAFLKTERFLYSGTLPLILVPITFAYAIVRFQLLNIRVILRKSLLYTVTTAVVTAIYALSIASFNLLFRGTALAESALFPVLFALAIVLLFEPLRQRIQGPVDKFFFAERQQLQRAIVELGEAFSGQMDLAAVVRQLVERLPALLGVRFAGLYLTRGERLVRAAGPTTLPAELPGLSLLYDHLKRHGALLRLDELTPLRLISPAAERLGDALASVRVEFLGLLASPRRTIGVVLLSERVGQTPLEREEVQLLRGLFQQASIALETSLLLEERSRQAELEGELRLAAKIQSSLLPGTLQSAEGWQVAAVCRPAREVGGDFYAQLPCPDGRSAFVYGDVSGKSISGALMMMAAHEVLNALALAHPEPEELLRLANERLYTLRSRRGPLQGGTFVALGYLCLSAGSSTLQYSLAGQPPPMIRRLGGEVAELQLPPHRVPLGALRSGNYSLLEVEVGIGDLVVAYSDGVVDARAEDGEAFGETRFAEVLRGCLAEPEAAVRELLSAIDQFTSGNTPYDDLTLVAMARLK